MPVSYALPQHLSRALPKSRLNRNDLYAGLLVFQILADARDSAAGADACDEDINLAVGVFKNLGTVVS